jgi:hypothetical protein
MNGNQLFPCITLIFFEETGTICQQLLSGFALTLTFLKIKNAKKTVLKFD